MEQHKPIERRKSSSIYVDLLLLEDYFESKPFKTFLWSLPVLISFVYYITSDFQEATPHRNLRWHDFFDDFHYQKWMFQVANAFLILSYVQVNFLYLRLVLLFASIFFILWGWLTLDVALDV